MTDPDTVIRWHLSSVIDGHRLTLAEVEAVAIERFGDRLVSIREWGDHWVVLARRQER